MVKKLLPSLMFFISINMFGAWPQPPIGPLLNDKEFLAHLRKFECIHCSVRLKTQSTLDNHEKLHV